MIWFFEKNSDLMICEIRHSSDGPTYEFEIAAMAGTAETRRFTSASELLREYLRKQNALRAQGWRPQLSSLTVLG